MFQRVRICCRRSTQRQRTTPSRELGAGFDQRRQLGFLIRAQPPRRPRRLVLDQPVRPRGIEALHPSAPPPPIHRAELGRRAPVLALVSRRNRQYIDAPDRHHSPPGLPRVPASRPNPGAIPPPPASVFSCISRLLGTMDRRPGESPAVAHSLRQLV